MCIKKISFGRDINFDNIVISIANDKQREDFINLCKSVIKQSDIKCDECSIVYFIEDFYTRDICGYFVVKRYIQNDVDTVLYCFQIIILDPKICVYSVLVHLIKVLFGDFILTEDLTTTIYTEFINKRTQITWHNHKKAARKYTTMLLSNMN